MFRRIRHLGHYVCGRAIRLRLSLNAGTVDQQVRRTLGAAMWDSGG